MATHLPHHTAPVFSLPLSCVGHSGHADRRGSASVLPLVSQCCHLVPLSWLLIIHIVTSKPTFKVAENSHHWVLKDVSVSLPSDSLSSSWWEYLLVFPWENIQLVASLILYLLVTELILAQLYRPFLTTTHGMQDLSFLTRDRTHGPWNGSLNPYLGTKTFWHLCLIYCHCFQPWGTNSTPEWWKQRSHLQGTSKTAAPRRRKEILSNFLPDLWLYMLHCPRE